MHNQEQVLLGMVAQEPTNSSQLVVDSLVSNPCRRESCVALRGFSLRGFWDVRGFPFCGGKKGLRLPLAMGKKKRLRPPRSLGRSMRNEGVSDSFSPLQKREREAGTLSLSSPFDISLLWAVLSA